MNNNIKLVEQYIGKNLNNNDYLIDSNGRDYEVVLYNNTIFRFPKNNDKILDIKIEKQKLDIISLFVDIQIPKYSIVDDKFIIYPFIQGKTLDKFKNGYTDQIINDLLIFLKQLHNIPLDKFSFLKETNEQIENKRKILINFVDSLKENIEKKLNKKVPKLIIKNINKYMDELFFVYESPNKAFVHTDLQEKNIIYNENTKQLSGIIDFTDSRIGGIELDFCNFYGLGNDILEKFIIGYLGYINKDFIERIFYLARRGILFEIDKYDITTTNLPYILEQLKKYKFN